MMSLENADYGQCLEDAVAANLQLVVEDPQEEASVDPMPCYMFRDVEPDFVAASAGENGPPLQECLVSLLQCTEADLVAALEGEVGTQATEADPERDADMSDGEDSDSDSESSSEEGEVAPKEPTIAELLE